MAKAIFHKAQRVYVKPVGTWALVREVIPHWVKDVDEPLRVTYDVGLGREFNAGELISESSMRGRDSQEGEDDLELEHWRVFRMKNRWQGNESAQAHPYPGTFPVVMTDDNDWGGWRVPGAEYDRDPQRIEHQARMIANAPHMVRLIRQFTECAARQPENVPSELIPLAKRATSILRHIFELTEEQSTIAAE
ncbi:MAG: hypothetical protein AAGK23_08680 [Pseudomonadota bacterium]